MKFIAQISGVMIPTGLVLLQRTEKKNPKSQKHAAIATFLNIRIVALLTSKTGTDKNRTSRKKYLCPTHEHIRSSKAR